MILQDLRGHGRIGLATDRAANRGRSRNRRRRTVSPRALQAVRRRAARFLRRPNYLSTFVCKEGRLAAIVGDTAGAVRAYRHYLGLRFDAEPSVRAEVDRVRGELAALLQKP